MYRVVNTHFNSRSYVSRLKETITDARVTKEEVTNCGVLSPKRNRELERSSAPPRPRHATRRGETPSAHVATEPPPWLRAASLGTSGLSPATAAPAAPLGETAHPSASTQAQRAARASGEPNPLLSDAASSRPAPPLPLLLGLLEKQPDPQLSFDSMSARLSTSGCPPKTLSKLRSSKRPGTLGSAEPAGGFRALFSR